MLLGIGTDILEIKRMEKSISNDRFIERVFTKKEIEFAEKTSRRNEIYAGTFCSKEAISKALGTGIRGFKLTDIEILRDELGKPFVNYHGEAKKIVENMRVENTFLSISHSDTNCVAFCVLERA